MTQCKLEAEILGGPYPRTCPTCGLSGKCAKGLDRASMMEEIRALRARVAELEAAQEWPPIETAPKDGTCFLAYYDGLVLMTKWGNPPGHQFHWMNADGRPRYGADPTHWRPLPAPPKEPTE